LVTDFLDEAGVPEYEDKLMSVLQSVRETLKTNTKQKKKSKEIFFLKCSLYNI
jgi:hypothetical protein